MKKGIFKDREPPYGVILAAFFCICGVVAVAMYMQTQRPYDTHPILRYVEGTIEDIRQLDGKQELVGGHKLQRRYAILTVKGLGEDQDTVFEFTITNETECVDELALGDTVEVGFIYDLGDTATSYLARSVSKIGAGQEPGEEASTLR